MQTADRRVKHDRKKSPKQERNTADEQGAARAMLEQEGVKFYYDRGRRLSKLRTGKPGKKFRIFSKGRTRTILIILIDIILIAILMYILNKPTNLYLEKSVEDVYYELNVTGIRGGKMLIGLTIKNLSDENMEISDSLPVLLKITGGDNSELTYEKYVEKNTVLLANEATSVIFLIDNEELPGTGQLDVVFESDVLFSRNVRF
jgi:hypothetical protein